jgi:hypothetical protein
METGQQLVFEEPTHSAKSNVRIGQSNRQKLLSELRKAKAAHIKWRSYAYAMLAGLEIDNELAPVRHTESVFGKWYHGPGQEAFGHLEIYASINVPHHMLHKIYRRAYEQSKHGRSLEAENEAALITELSRQVLDALALVEQELIAMSNPEAG